MFLRGKGKRNGGIWMTTQMNRKWVFITHTNSSSHCVYSHSLFLFWFSYCFASRCSPSLRQNGSSKAVFMFCNKCPGLSLVCELLTRLSSCSYFITKASASSVIIWIAKCVPPLKTGSEFKSWLTMIQIRCWVSITCASSSAFAMAQIRYVESRQGDKRLLKTLLPQGALLGAYASTHKLFLTFDMLGLYFQKLNIVPVIVVFRYVIT